MTSPAAEPAFDGQCGFAVSTGKLGVEGSPRFTLEDGDRTVLFKNRAARFLWRVLPDRAAKADLVWSGGTR